MNEVTNRVQTLKNISRGLEADYRLITMIMIVISGL